MLIYKAEDLLRFDLLSRSVQIDQKHPGVIIIVIRAEPELIDVVCQFGFPRMRSRCEKTALHIRFPEWTERIDDQDIRIQIQDAVHALRQKFCRKETVIHLPGYWLLTGAPRKASLLISTGWKPKP